METAEMSRILLSAKKQKKLTFRALAEAVGMSEVYVASVLYGENSASEEVARKIAKLLDAPEAAIDAMTSFPVKGNSLAARTIPTDPLLYRFYEILAVYGLPLKDLIQEKFGDGIMSAIDFTMEIEKVSDPKGDRVQLTMSGKFLPYKKW
jgi:cyanate lyase